MTARRCSSCEDRFCEGVYLNDRAAPLINIPILAQTKVNRSDILRIAGSGAAVAEAVKNLGYADRPTKPTWSLSVWA
jgi:hypothetical protein